MLRPLVEIFRLEGFSPDGTFGAVLVNGEFTCLSLELPWRDNQENLSCIHPGEYLANRIHSKRFNMDTFQLINVPGRQFIEFHIGNTVNDTDGCILLGSYIAKFDVVRGIAASKRAFLHFMNLLGTAPEILVRIRKRY